MNTTLGINHEEIETSYEAEFGRDREPTQMPSRRPAYRRSGSAPARVSGMHHRRNKRWTWGSGRGARMLNMQAFAGCLTLAVASIAASAVGSTVTFNYVTIGNPGNPGNPASNPADQGAVSDIFKMAATETTNAQYVAFLNAVGSSNTHGIYNASMTSEPVGGITREGVSGSFTYAVKSGTAASGASYANMPVNFVSWFSAARFVNWIANGQLTGVAGIASMETGSYTLNNATSGSIIPRNAGATVFLPSSDEWYKAAFYTGTSYTLFPTNTNTAPSATWDFDTPNAGNFNNVTTSPVAVGSYTNNSVSAYGLYDMLGNVNEFTDTAGTGSDVRVMGGGVSATADAWNSQAAAAFRPSAEAAGGVGFRVAAVPEPDTIVLAIMGGVVMTGAGWMKRRRVGQASGGAASAV